MNNCFCKYVLTLKTIKGQVSLEGVGGGSRHPLVDIHLKRKKGFFSKGSIFLWGGGRGKHFLWRCVPLIAKEEAQ